MHTILNAVGMRKLRNIDIGVDTMMYSTSQMLLCASYRLTMYALCTVDIYIFLLSNHHYSEVCSNPQLGRIYVQSSKFLIYVLLQQVLKRSLILEACVCFRTNG